MLDKQKYLNFEMRVKFDVPVRKDFDIDKFSEEELEDIAIDYLFNEKGYDTADYYDFEFRLD